MSRVWGAVALAAICAAQPCMGRPAPITKLEARQQPQSIVIRRVLDQMADLLTGEGESCPPRRGKPSCSILCGPPRSTQRR